MRIIRPVEFPAMDGLRFYAAFLVFMTHFIGSVSNSIFNDSNASGENEKFLHDIFVFLGDGNHGVDIFFILSGFLMGRIAFSDKRPFSYKNFINSRFWRIYPTFLISYFAVVLLDLHFGWLWSLPDAIAGLLFLNAIPALGVTPYHYVSWSIGFEFSFYLIFPIILFTPKVISKKTKTFLAFFLFLILTGSNQNFSWMIRISGLFLGLWISCFDTKILFKIGKSIPWILAISPYLIYIYIKQYLPYLESYLLLLASISLLFISTVFGNNPLSKLASLPLFRFLGTISYSFYLWHTMCITASLFVLLPFFGLTAYGNQTTALLHLLTSFSLSTIVSYLSYILTEQHYFKRRP